MRKHLNADKLLRLIVLAAAVMTMCLALCTAGADTTKDGFEYEVCNKKVIITGYQGTESAPIIPSEINGKSVIGIGGYAFYGNTRLISVTIPDCVTDIGWHAFDGCTALESVTLPKDITVIPESLFAKCTALKRIEVPKKVKTIEKRAFFGCNGLESIVLPQSVKEIGEDVFAEIVGEHSIQIEAEEGSFAYAYCTDYFRGLLTAEAEAAAEAMPEPVAPAEEIPAAAPVITLQPADQSAAIGETVAFTVAADGEGLTYQWQYAAKDSDKWKDSTKEGCTADTLPVKATKERDGQQYRCVITDATGEKVTSDAAVLTVTTEEVPDIITLQPEDQSAAIGETVEFKVEAVGDGLTYQWQYAAKDSKKWKDSTKEGCNTDTLPVKVTKERDGQQYRCVVTDANGAAVTSDTAVLTVAP